MCHVLLALPFISLVLFLILPFDQAMVIYSVILLISVILYWLRREYRARVPLT